MTEGLQKGELMAVGVVQNGYENQAYSYSTQGKMQAGGFDVQMALAAKSGEESENMSVANTSYVDMPEMSNANKEFNKEAAMQLIAKHREELYEKLKNNDTEESFQIGGTSFTLKEWEKLLEEFDSVQEEIRKQMALEQARRQENITSTAEMEETTSVTAKDSADVAKTAGVTQTNFTTGVEETEGTLDDSVVESLTAESTTFTYSSNNDDKKYIMWYTQEGMYCREEGQIVGYHFRMTFEDESEYEKVKDFFGRVPENVNMTFAGNRIFWQKLLAGEVNEEGFIEWMKTCPDGYKTEDITYSKNGSLLLDREKAGYAVYMNPFLANMVHPGVEMEEYQADSLLRRYPLKQNAREALETMFDDVAEGVEVAWKKAQEDAGVDATGIHEDGTLFFISEFMKQWQIRQNRGYDTIRVFGKSMESAINYAKKALHSLQNPTIRETNMNYAVYKEKEEEFYERFIENLEYYQKYGKLE